MNLLKEEKGNVRNEHVTQMKMPFCRQGSQPNVVEENLST